MRGTTRTAVGVAEIEAAGAEAIVADPDRVATLMPALDQVTVAVILLGSATGSAAALGELHGSRLDMLLTKLVDTTIRGVVYEAAGSVDDEVLAAGSRRVKRFAEQTHASCQLLQSDPAQAGAWLREARGAVALALGGG